MMSCNHAQQIMDAFFDQDKLANIPWEVWQHLHQCPECQFHFRSLQGLNDAIEALENRPLQSDATLLDVPSLLKASSHSLWRSASFWKVTAAAALLLVVLMLGIQFRPGSGEVNPVTQPTPDIFLEEVRVADQPTRYLVYQPNQKNAKYTIIWMF